MKTTSKRCSGCGETKLAAAFHRKTATKDGLQTYCKLCQGAHQRGWTQANYAHALELHRMYRQDHPTMARDSMRRSRERDPEPSRRATRKYRRAHRAEIRDRQRARKQRDTMHRLTCNIRNRLSKAIRGGYKAGSAIRDLGCSVEALMLYFSKLFTSGMSWDNYGEWQIDHIIPLASFDLTDPVQVKRACHYTNLQPLWAEDNARKGARLVEVA